MFAAGLRRRAKGSGEKWPEGSGNLDELGFPAGISPVFSSKA